MKISGSKGIDIKPIRSRSTEARLGTRAGSNKDVGPFDELLKAAVGVSKGDGRLPLADPPLGRERLLYLVEMVRMQMDRCLFDTLARFDDDSINESAALTPEGLPGIDQLLGPSMSKIEQPLYDKEVATLPELIEDVIAHASRKYDVEPELIRAVIRAESDFDVYSTSHKGAMGLMQLMPKTARDLGVKNPYDPVENIMGGTRYLKGLLERYDGDVSIALAAYNWGPGNLERNQGRLPRETRTYISRVNRYYREAKS